MMLKSRGKSAYRNWPRALIALTAATAGLGPVAALGASDAPYVGVWVIELRNCGAPPSDPQSPIEITRDGYDHFKTHCTFRSVEPREGDFKISAECIVDGAASTSEIVLTVSGNTLTFTDEVRAQDYLRCR